MSYLQDSSSEKRKKVRIHHILEKKGGKPLSMLTCYDATFARLLEKTSLDMVLVGDSLGNIMKGEKNTLNVSIEEMAYHTKMVASTLKTPFLVSDMPFGTVGFEDEKCFYAATLLLKSGAEAVKIEGAHEKILSQINTLVQNGIPVMGHLGLTPQSVHALGGYRKQGKTFSQKEKLLEDALLLEKAGCFALVLELTEPDISQLITSRLKIPTIGIGAGPFCDGQVLVLQDMLGMNNDFKASFLKKFASLEEVILGAVENYHHEVRERTFPS